MGLTALPEKHGFSPWGMPLSLPPPLPLPSPLPLPLPLPLSPLLPLLLGTPRLQPWVSQPCRRSRALALRYAVVVAAAIAVAAAVAVAVAAALAVTVVAVLALAVASRYPKASALGLTALPENRSLSSWGMPLSLPRPLPLPSLLPLRLSPFFPPPLLLGTPTLQPWVSQPCQKSASAPGFAVRAAALALASRYPKASALGLTALPEKRGFSPWGMPLSLPPPLPLPPLSPLPLSSFLPPPLLLGTPRLQPWVSQPRSKKRGFSPWGMLSCPWPPSATSST